MEKIKKISFVLLMLIIALYLFVVISPKLIPGFYPFGIKTAIVLSGSMSPEIDINDFVIMRKPGKLAVGDIVAYEEEVTNAEVLHRIIKIDGESITTKGDANNTEDKPINASQITGIYIGKIGFLGWLLSFLSHPIVFSAIITCLTIIAIISVKRHLDRKKRRENAKKKN